VRKLGGGGRKLYITETRTLPLAAKQVPNVLFYMPNRPSISYWFQLWLCIEDPRASVAREGLMPVGKGCASRATEAKPLLPGRVYPSTASLV
jgi:hypothetical protein